MSSIRAKVTLGASALSLLLITALTALALQSMRRDFARVLEAQQASLVEQVAADLDAKLAEDLDVLTRTAAVLPLDALDSPERLRAFLAPEVALLTLFDDVLVLDATGRIVADVPALDDRAGVSVADRPLFQQVLRTGAPVISEPMLGRYRQSPVVNMAAPVRDPGGQVVAFLIGVLRLERPNVIGRLAGAHVGRTGYFALLTRGPNPVYVIHRDPQRILQPRARFRTMPAATAALEAGGSGAFEGRNSSGVLALFSYRALRTVNWLLVAVLPVEEAFAPLSAAQRNLSLIAAVLAVLVAVATWLMAARLLAPLTRLRDHMRGMREPAHAAAPAPVERHDEIGDLATTFNLLMADRARAAAALEQRAGELRLASRVFETTADAVIVTDAEDRVLMVNPAFTRMTGFAAEEMAGKLLTESAFRPLDPARSVERMAEQRRMGEGGTEVVRYRKDGSELALWVTASNITDERGRITHVVRVFSDISHLKASQRKLEALAGSDALTALANRRVLDERLAAVLAARRGFALMYVDLDGFKPVNDTLGHERGDVLLRMVAARLQSCVRGGDTLARVGGDEFAIVIEHGDARAEAPRVAERVLVACAQPFDVHGHRVHISASVGIALYPDDGGDAATLLATADAAMYTAKRAGGNRFASAPAAPQRQVS
jgi:diguanylate cyclase (GGDEF)-like protein/PAS domain S-box-containing protein